MANKWKEKNVGVSLKRGQSKKRPVIDERDGSEAGHHIEHWDDHVDAVATPPPVKARLKTVSKEED